MRASEDEGRCSHSLPKRARICIGGPGEQLSLLAHDEARKATDVQLPDFTRERSEETLSLQHSPSSKRDSSDLVESIDGDPVTGRRGKDASIESGTR